MKNSEQTFSIGDIVALKNDDKYPHPYHYLLLERAYEKYSPTERTEEPCWKVCLLGPNNDVNQFSFFSLFDRDIHIYTKLE